MQCRACMQFDGESVDMGYVVSEENKNLYDYFNECTQLYATPKDNLPKSLCMTCAENVQVAYNFRKEAVRCDEELRKITKLPKVESNFDDNSDDQLEFLEFEVCKADSFSEYEIVEENELSTSSLSIDMYGTVQEDMENQLSIGICQNSCLTQHFLESSDVSTQNNKVEDESKYTPPKYNSDICESEYPTKYSLTADHKDDVTCTKCSKTFDSIRELLLHDTFSHTTSTQIRCPLCEYPKHIPRQVVIEHVKTNHKDSYVKHFTADDLNLNDDQNDFSNASEIAVAKQINTIVCSICSECFQEHNDYKSHMKIHHHSKTIVKKMLAETDGYSNELVNSNSTELNQKSNDVTEVFECFECPKLFQVKKSLQRHIRMTHAGIKPKHSGHAVRDMKLKKNARNNAVGEENSSENLVTCNYCDKKLLPNKIKAHENRHSYKLKKTGRYICSHCPREFSNEMNVKAHEKRVHLHRPEPKECPVCHKKVNTKYFQSHVRNVHATVRRYKCDICGDAYKTNMQLTEHKLLHFERKIPCSLCNKKFTRKNDLKIHMRIHTGEKPYECHLCGQQFRVKAHLTYHLQQHAGIKYTCKECGKEFNDIKQLKVHSYKHTGMPYKCPVCNYQCALRTVFSKHLFKVHDMTMTPAEYCAMFKENTGRNPVVRSVEELQSEANI